jgi:hypothetical protein
LTGANDLIRGLTTITYGGTLSLVNVQGTIGPSSSFKLFSSEIYRGVFAGLTPSTPGPDLAWNTNTLATDGTLRIVSLSPTSLSSSISDNVLKLTWPADHTGWRLQTQANTNSIGSIWTDVADSITTNEMAFAINSTWTGAYFRLRYQ